LGDRQCVPVTVEQVTPTVDVRATPARVAYNETVQVTGRIDAESGGVANVSYFVIVDGSVFARNETHSDGRFATNVTVPADAEPASDAVSATFNQVGGLLDTDGTGGRTAD
jgi:hypothetical protein